jgi:hypothetical protein
MNHQVKQRLTKRVADYFVVVGGGDVFQLVTEEETTNKRDKEKQLLHISYQADIIDRYPLEDRPDFALPDGIQLFCLPNGLEISLPCSPSFHSFVHTSENGSHILGCCLTIYEPLTEQQIDSINANDIDGTSLSKFKSGAKLFAPLCLCLISHWPFVQSFKAFLCGLYRMSLTRSVNCMITSLYIKYGLCLRVAL